MKNFFEEYKRIREVKTDYFSKRGLLLRRDSNFRIFLVEKIRTLLEGDAVATDLIF